MPPLTLPSSAAEVHLYQPASGRLLHSMALLTLKVHNNSHYASLSERQSARVEDDQRLLGLIKYSWPKSCGALDYRTYEGWLYLAVMLDLSSCQVVIWLAIRPLVRY